MRASERWQAIAMAFCLQASFAAISSAAPIALGETRVVCDSTIAGGTWLPSFQTLDCDRADGDGFFVGTTAASLHLPPGAHVNVQATGARGSAAAEVHYFMQVAQRQPPPVSVPAIPLAVFFQVERMLTRTGLGPLSPPTPRSRESPAWGASRPINPSRSRAASRSRAPSTRRCSSSSSPSVWCSPERPPPRCPPERRPARRTRTRSFPSTRRPLTRSWRARGSRASRSPTTSRSSTART